VVEIPTDLLAHIRNQPQSQSALTLKDYMPTNPTDGIPPVRFDIINWLLNPHGSIEFGKAKTFRIMGIQESGKSNAGEVIATHYLARGCRVLDVLSAGDNEGLGWLDSPWAKSLLFLTGSDMKLTGTNVPQVKAKDFNIETLEKDFPGTKIVVSAPAFFSYQVDRYRAIGRMAEDWILRSSWEAIDLILMREAQLFLRSQATVQTFDAEQKFLEFFWEVKHHGFGLVADSQRWQDLHKAIRDLADYSIFKRFGVMSIPDDMSWLLSWIPPNKLFVKGQMEEGLRTLRPDQFFMLTIDRAIAQGTLDLCPWHIKRVAEKQVSLLTKFSIVPEKLEANGPTAPTQPVIAADPDRLTVRHPDESLPPEEVKSSKQSKISKPMHDLLIANSNHGMGLRRNAEEVTKAYGVPLSHTGVRRWVQRHRAGECPEPWGCNAAAAP
jgi:hypothetical protein